MRHAEPASAGGPAAHDAAARGSHAAQNRLQPGDLVLGSSAGQFNDLAGFRASFENKPAQLLLQIQRGNRRGNLQMQ